MRAPVRAALGTALFTAVLFFLVGSAFYAGYLTARVGAPVPLVGSLPLPPGVAPSRRRQATAQVRVASERPGLTGSLQIAGTSGEIKTSAVKARLLPGNVAYLQLLSFSGSASGDMVEQLKQVLDSRPVGLVVDLRNNPGGLLQG